MSNGLAVDRTELPFPLVARGKVRDIYDVGDDRLLLVATDRISAFDVVMEEPIPHKGAVLTQITAVRAASASSECCPPSTSTTSFVRWLAKSTMK